MSKYFDLLKKYYNKKASDSEKRQLVGLLSYREIWCEDFDDVWGCSFGAMPNATDERILEEISSATKIKQRICGKHLLYLFPMAASLLLCILSGYLWQENKMLTRYSDMIVEVGKGQKSDLYLPDGTKVYLNADSKLKYGNCFNGRQRVVELIGEGFFKIAPDRNSPFIVKTGNLEIRALGTAFNVKAYHNDDKITTYLVEGSVEVSSYDNTVRLQPGDRLIYAKISNDLQKLVSGDENYYTSWMNDELVFDNQPLMEIVKILERHYNVSFRIKSEKLRGYTFSGTLKNSSLQSALDALQFTSSIKYHKKGNVIELEY